MRRETNYIKSNNDLRKRQGHQDIEKFTLIIPNIYTAQNKPTETRSNLF